MRLKMISAAVGAMMFAGSAFAAPPAADEAAAALVLALGAAAIDKVVQSADVEALALFQVSVAPPVPEPHSWAMMILGFGLVGALVRRQRPAAAH
jgi:hypothetical protein